MSGFSWRDIWYESATMLNAGTDPGILKGGVQQNFLQGGQPLTRAFVSISQKAGSTPAMYMVRNWENPVGVFVAQ